uniref:Uncharacterized protein n=1 Tax=Streptomyces sp. NBC_01401 TaxID=2903854 RepID=A0AAU3H709_9ACTN
MSAQPPWLSCPARATMSASMLRRRRGQSGATMRSHTHSAQWSSPARAVALMAAASIAVTLSLAPGLRRDGRRSPVTA